MTYQEAEERLLIVRWKTIDCETKDCWCQSIVPEKPIIDDQNDEHYVVPSGIITREIAKRIVSEHNELNKQWV